jgi:hypothetical protein
MVNSQFHKTGDNWRTLATPVCFKVRYFRQSASSASPYKGRRTGVAKPTPAWNALAEGRIDLIKATCGLASKPHRFLRSRPGPRADRQRESSSAFRVSSAVRWPSTLRRISGLPRSPQAISLHVGSGIGSKVHVCTNSREQFQVLEIVTAPVWSYGAPLGRDLCGATEQAAERARAICQAKRKRNTVAIYIKASRNRPGRVGAGGRIRSPADISTYLPNIPPPLLEIFGPGKSGKLGSSENHWTERYVVKPRQIAEDSPWQR